MKKLLIVSVLALLVPAAGMSAATRPPQDFVVGGGKHLGFGTGPDVITEAISAHVLPNGKLIGHVTSSVNVAAPGPSTGAVHGFVTCLIVNGNNAYITWRVDKAGSGLEEGTIVVTHVLDGGDPSAPDFIRNSFAGFIVPVQPPAGQEGPCFVPVLPPVAVIQGNYTVHDG